MITQSAFPVMGKPSEFIQSGHIAHACYKNITRPNIIARVLRDEMPLSLAERTDQVHDGRMAVKETQN